MQDISGSHVMRSLLSVLSGRQVVQDKRGKNAKHRDIWQSAPKEGLNQESKLGGSGNKAKGNGVVYNVPQSFSNVSAVLSGGIYRHAF